MDNLGNLFNSIFFALFAVIAAGVWCGALRLGGLTLGAAGVFFVGLVFGHFQWSLPRELTDLGLVLFVYAVGLQAGPRFLATLRDGGPACLLVGGGATLAGAATALLLAGALGLPAHMAAGLYCGATTCTPALAGVLDVLQGAAADLVPDASVAYGAAYPFSIAAAVLLVQLLPKLVRTTPAAAAQAYREAELARRPPLEKCVFRVENPGCAGRSLEELRGLHLFEAVICRLKRAGVVHPVRPDTILAQGDALLAVGVPTELAKLEAVLGGLVLDDMQDPSGQIASEQVVVSRPDVFGRRLAELCLWERHGVSVTRLRRDGIEISPDGSLHLEPGDILRLVGNRDAMAAAMATVGQQERQLDEATIVSFAAGIAAGAVVGLIPIPLPGGVQVRLGLAGGAFVVALLLGHLGTRGWLRIYVPGAARHFVRELGLVIFLAGAGMGAGQKFVPVLQQAGPQLLLAGALVTLVTLASAALLSLLALRWNVLFSAGALAATLTNPPALSAAGRLAPDTDAAAVGFASVYPLALISKIVWAPLIYLWLSR